MDEMNTTMALLRAVLELIAKGAIVHISDEEVQKRISHRLRHLADTPDLLTQPPIPEAVPSMDALRIQNELNLCFNRPDINPDYM